MVTTLSNDRDKLPKREASGAAEFVMGELRSNPELTFAEVKERAHKNGFEIFPLLYGRAKKALGLVTAKPAAAEQMPARRPVTGLLPGIVAREKPAEADAPGEIAQPTRGRGRALGPVMEFVVAALVKNPQATNAEVKSAAVTAGLKVTPQDMVRARARLGLPGQRQAARQRAQTEAEVPSPTAAPRTPKARPRAARSAAGRPVDLESLVASIREIEEERDRLQEALERIVQIIEALV